MNNSLRHVMAAMLCLLFCKSEAQSLWKWHELALCESRPEDVTGAFGRPKNDSYNIFSYTYEQVNRPFQGVRRNYSEVEFHFTNVDDQNDEYYLYKIRFEYDEGFPFWDVRSLAAALTKKWFGDDAIVDDDDHERFSARPKWAPIAATAIYMGGSHGGTGGLSIVVTDCEGQDVEASGFN